MRTITNEELIVAAKAAYDAGTLVACLAERGLYKYSQCYYRRRIEDTEIVGICAIGAALNDDEHRLIREKDINGNSISYLLSSDICRFEDEQFARTLQQRHDLWVGAIESKSQTLDTIKLHFLNALNYKKE